MGLEFKRIGAPTYLCQSKGGRLPIFSGQQRQRQNMVYFEHQGGLGKGDASAGGIRRLVAGYLRLADFAGMINGFLEFSFGIL